MKPSLPLMVTRRRSGEDWEYAAERAKIKTTAATKITWQRSQYKAVTQCHCSVQRDITVENRWDEKAGLRTGCGVRSQVIDVLEAQIKKRPAMKKVSTAVAKQSRNISQQKLTIGLDLGDRNSWYCVLDEAGKVQLEQRVRTHAQALREVFGAMPRSRIALETGGRIRPGSVACWANWGTK